MSWRLSRKTTKGRTSCLQLSGLGDCITCQGFRPKVGDGHCFHCGGQGPQCRPNPIRRVRMEALRGGGFGPSQNIKKVQNDQTERNKKDIFYLISRRCVPEENFSPFSEPAKEGGVGVRKVGLISGACIWFLNAPEYGLFKGL